MAGQLRPGLELRTITGDEYTAWSQAVSQQFGGDVSDEELDAYRGVTDLDQTYGVFDGDQVVGTTGAYPFSMTVPGGEQLRCAGITAVGGRTSHRRQGLLTAMMRRQLADLAAAGLPLAALLASESGIYGRFGYGPAIPTVSVAIDRHAAQFAAGNPPAH
ncbi:MAG: GNAT family N-acetyltransferase [Actinomycetota bacterium]|nr:GNAT family N-acetyltransferase [Actinomycetota bacterium]